MENFEKTIRKYEWKGLISIYNCLTFPKAKWLDFGCGTGGLINFARKQGIDIVGFDEGWATRLGRKYGATILDIDEIKHSRHQFDFITAIEVIEHIPDPLNLLSKIRSLLKPNGILFLTTGNAKPWRYNWEKWAYTDCPDIHISFFEPETLSLALKKTGFSPQNLKFNDGFSSLLKFKILKTLKFKNVCPLSAFFPWKIITQLVDIKYKLSEHPYGIAIE